MRGRALRTFFQMVFSILIWSLSAYRDSVSAEALVETDIPALSRNIEALKPSFCPYGFPEQSTVSVSRHYYRDVYFALRL